MAAPYPSPVRPLSRVVSTSPTSNATASAEFKVAEGRVVLDVANGTPVSVSVEAGIRLIRGVTEKKTVGLTKTVMEVGEVEVKSRRLRVDVYFD